MTWSIVSEDGFKKSNCYPWTLQKWNRHKKLQS